LFGKKRRRKVEAPSWDEEVRCYVEFLVTGIMFFCLRDWGWGLQEGSFFES
jgi:hypothetical protein